MTGSVGRPSRMRWVMRSPGPARPCPDPIRSRGGRASDLTSTEPDRYATRPGRVDASRGLARRQRGLLAAVVTRDTNTPRPARRQGRRMSDSSSAAPAPEIAMAASAANPSLRPRDRMTPPRLRRVARPGRTHDARVTPGHRGGTCCFGGPVFHLGPIPVQYPQSHARRMPADDTIPPYGSWRIRRCTPRDRRPPATAALRLDSEGPAASLRYLSLTVG